MSIAPRLQDAVEALIAKHGSLKAAARASGISYTYLCNLRTGIRGAEPSDALLRKLGLRRITIYQWTKP